MGIPGPAPGKRTPGDSIFRVFVEKLGDTQRSNFIGNEGELFYDPTTQSIFISDGETVGGRRLANEGLDDLADIIGDLDGTNIQQLYDVLVKLTNDKYDKVGGTITGPMSVVPNPYSTSASITVDEYGVFVDRLPTKNNQVSSKEYVDTTTIPFNISRLSSI